MRHAGALRQRQRVADVAHPQHPVQLEILGARELIPLANQVVQHDAGLVDIAAVEENGRAEKTVREPEQVVGPSAGIPFGGLVGGLLVGGFGMAGAMLACGAAYFVATMLPALQPRWREMDRRP